MELKQRTAIEIPAGLIDAIRSFPAERETEHCGTPLRASPFDFYAQCPRCGVRVKLRSFSGGDEIEDIFDAVFDWMNHPIAKQAAARRQQTLEAESHEE